MSTPAEVVADTLATTEAIANDMITLATTAIATLNAAIQAEPTIDVEFVTPEAPSALTPPESPEIEFDPTILNPPAVPALLESLEDDLEFDPGGAIVADMPGDAPSVTIDDAVVDAIWDRARDREIATMQADLDEASRTSEALGFALPAGVVAAQVRQAQANYYAKVSSLNRDAAIERMKMEIENIQMTIAAYQAQWEGWKARVQAEAERIRAIAAKTSAAVQAYQAQWDGAKVRVLAESERVKALVEGFRAETDLFRAAVSQDIEFWRASIASYEATRSYVLQSAKINSDITRSNRDSVLEAGKAQAQIFSQMAAAAIGRLNVSAGVDGRSSTNVSYQYSGQVDSTVTPIASI
jgi:hypothetical protein